MKGSHFDYRFHCTLLGLVETGAHFGGSLELDPGRCLIIGYLWYIHTLYPEIGKYNQLP
jgi:hypothetical protein